MSLFHGTSVVRSGLVTYLDAASVGKRRVGYNDQRNWSSGWSGSVSNPSNSFDGNLTTGTSVSVTTGTATYTFSGGLAVTGTIRIYCSLGATAGQVGSATNIIVVDGTDITSKLKTAGFYTTAGWIDITTEVGATFNTVVIASTINVANPFVYAIEVDGQILLNAWLDISGNENHFVYYNSPTFNSSNNTFTFNGTNQYAVSLNNINLSSYDSVTTIIFAKTNNTSASQLFEHTTDWNTVTGGFGLATHTNGTVNTVNIHHTNHNVGAAFARNYDFAVSTNWAMHVNIFSRITDSTGRLTYGNDKLLSYSTNGGYATTTSTGVGSFANAKTYLASRAGTLSFNSCDIGSFMIYGRKLSAFEILQNFNAHRGRYGI